MQEKDRTIENANSLHSGDTVAAPTPLEQSPGNTGPQTEKKSLDQLNLLDRNQPLWKPLLVFLIPLIISNGLNSLGGTVSSVIMGRGLGESALAAASAVFPVTFFLVSLVIGLGSASSILIGQAYGAGDNGRLKQTVNTSLKFSFLLGVLMGAVGVFFSRQLLAWIGTPASIIDESADFARILFAFLPIQFMYINYTTFLRGTGDSKTPLYFLVINIVLNILLTPVLAFGWLGLPALQLNGVAIANIFSFLVATVLLFVYLKMKNHILALDRGFFSSLKLDGEILRLLVRIGLPTSIQMIFVSLSGVAVISLINAYGERATAAYGAVIQVITYVQLPALSLGMAAGIFGSQLIGANVRERLKELLISAVTLNYVIGFLLVSLVYLFSGSILSWFLVEPHTLALAKQILYIVLWAYMIFGHASILSGMMRSSGTVLWPTVIGIISIWGVQVPTAYFLSHTLGLKGIWMAYPISFLFNVSVQYMYYRFFWKTKQHQSFFANPS
ncbi:MATE family efflux transporter [Lihuaxuella thermophila]|uniref:Putative efflux protein, MATE family n=1 Tax=Lihuaxuella thermophila TaxID=1173111 RepID=A0A1H8ADC9_9BACL|nr:MATE family efflux transporter [Lihuaxuella thermophila]SEM68765.1 putative efflux protein, MATE family [Lihuaxuella thermophila]